MSPFILYALMAAAEVGEWQHGDMAIWQQHQCTQLNRKRSAASS